MTSIQMYSMSGDVLTTFTADDLEDCNVYTLVEDMEQDECRGVPGARHHASYPEIFVERYCLIIGERILQGHEDVLPCINDPTSAGKRLMLYKKPVSPRTVKDKCRETWHESMRIVAEKKLLPAEELLRAIGSVGEIKKDGKGKGGNGKGKTNAGPRPANTYSGVGRVCIVCGCYERFATFSEDACWKQGLELCQFVGEYSIPTAEAGLSLNVVDGPDGIRAREQSFRKRYQTDAHDRRKRVRSTDGRPQLLRGVSGCL